MEVDCVVLESPEIKPELIDLGGAFDYSYGDFSIALPKNHMLPVHQKLHKKYDRFLPHLAKYIKPHEAIIDVGANVGDTLAGMVEQNASSSYICIEPDHVFFAYLQSNIKTIKKAKPSLKVECIQSLVGKNVSGVSLEGHGGTKHAVVSDDGNIKSRPLDELLVGKNYANIRVLKTDVDGFDYDVIDSSMQVVAAHKPLIFLECQNDHAYQKDGYVKMFKSLALCGYADWTVFDNYGELVLRTKSLDVVFQLMAYVWSQNMRRTTRTIYYFDVLAAQDHDVELVDRVMADYT